MRYELNVVPNTKPRMTQADVWRKRPCVLKYREYKDRLREECLRVDLTELKSQMTTLIFYIPMPASWSKRKKELMNGTLHLQTPDMDNLLKGFQDALATEDKHIASIKGELGKYWAYSGRIVLEQ